MKNERRTSELKAVVDAMGKSVGGRVAEYVAKMLR
jgi:ribosomal protein L13